MQLVSFDHLSPLARYMIFYPHHFFLTHCIITLKNQKTLVCVGLTKNCLHMGHTPLHELLICFQKWAQYVKLSSSTTKWLSDVLATIGKLSCHSRDLVIRTSLLTSRRTGEVLIWRLWCPIKLLHIDMKCFGRFLQTANGNAKEKK
jgi:hypothetical protein